MSESSAEMVEGYQQAVDAQIAYADVITEAMLPYVSEVMRKHPPPDGDVPGAVAGWIQALTQLQLVFVQNFKISELELVVALRLLAEDIEQGVFRRKEAARAGQPGAAPEMKVDF